MSSSSQRDFYDFLDNHPRLEAALEVVFNVLIGFAPFIIIAVAKSDAQKEITPMFMSFFSAGEIIISVFTTCASILWLAFFKPQKIQSKIGRFFVLLAVIAGLLFSGVIISGNVGFKEEISIYSQKLIWTSYAGALLIWFLANIWNTNSSDGSISDPVKNIDSKYGVGG